jgi:hypothetical protein
VNFSFSRGGRRRPWWRLEFGNGYGEACSAPLEVEEGGRWGRVGQKAKLTGWLLGRLGRKMKKKFFQNKIGFLNLPRLCKFVQGNLGGIWILGFFLNSSRILKDFRKIQYDMP